MPFLVSLLILIAVSVVLGGIPLTAWIVKGLAGRKLAHLGTGNVSVSAAFYHGGTLVGVLSVIAEALKGIGAVLLARSLFPQTPALEILALIMLVVGRYWAARGAGVTNVVWGYVVHDWRVAFFVALIGGISFTLFREQRRGRLAVLCLLPVITLLLHPNDGLRGLLVMVLCTLIGWIYSRIPNDLDLPAEDAAEDSRQVFTFFRGDRALISLDNPLSAAKVGGKAATLAQLRQWNYAVLPGWVLPPGDDPEPLIAQLDPSPEAPVIVRSSAIGEDSEAATAAGQYDSIANVTSREALRDAILRCQSSYSRASAGQYRAQTAASSGGMAVLVQPQIKGVFSGVAFSRDPIARQGDAVLVEALPGDAAQVVSGKVTPEPYRVLISETIPDVTDAAGQPIPTEITLPVEGEGEVPSPLIQQVACLARQIEQRYHGVPQDIEWSYDGQQLWLLQARPITTLLPIWTRRIAAEVIPGHIRPLTWSVNQPLTCGVWGDLFRLVLGDRASDLDFMQTATLHHSVAYFNASLLGDIFGRMGLPPESLESLTQGTPFTRPPLKATLCALPGLLRLLGREWLLQEDFAQDQPQHQSQLQAFQERPAAQCSDSELLTRIDAILEALQRVTYYNILAPLSAAFRQAILRVKDEDLDQGVVPEVAAMRSLRRIAHDSRHLLPPFDATYCSTPVVFTTIAEDVNGDAILAQIDQFITTYGHMSEVATDIAVPRWTDDPRPIRDLFARFICEPTDGAAPADEKDPQRLSWRSQRVQSRLALKAQVADLYNRLLAQLRWSVVALEHRWRDRGLLQQEGDIFFLTLAEIRQQVTQTDAAADRPDTGAMQARIDWRRSQWESDKANANPAQLVYGHEPPEPKSVNLVTWQQQGPMTLQGIGASPGQAVGRVRVISTLTSPVQVDKTTILVVPYTDAGWAPILAQAGGIVAQAGGRLSHGAIIAREFQIPAVMNVPNAMERLRDGQRIQIDGQQGTVIIV